MNSAVILFFITIADDTAVFIVPFIRACHLLDGYQCFEKSYQCFEYSTSDIISCLVLVYTSNSNIVALHYVSFFVVPTIL